jgi:hypothetical protein
MKFKFRLINAPRVIKAKIKKNAGAQVHSGMNGAVYPCGECAKEPFH